ncbi:MAG: rod shape-determining protein MreD [bacterium]|nr:rod shape-determining protein MreD [bacterium]
MKSLPIFAANIFLALCQIVLVAAFSSWSIFPNLFLIVVVWFVLNHQAKEGFITAIFGGLFMDLYSGHLLGIGSLGLILLWFFLMFTSGEFFSREASLPLLISFLVFGSVFFQVMTIFQINVLHFFFNDVQSVEINSTLIFHLVLAIFANLLLLYPLSVLLRKMLKNGHEPKPF